MTYLQSESAYAFTRIRAHMESLCDADTCPLAHPEISVCDFCEEGVYGQLETCIHGQQRCDDCGLCPECSTEARRP